MESLIKSSSESSDSNIMNHFFEKEELWRNDLYIFYKNRLTTSASEYAIDKWKLKNISVVYVESLPMFGKDAEEIFEVANPPMDRAYLIIDTKKNEIISDDYSYESILYRIDFMGISKSFNR